MANTEELIVQIKALVDAAKLTALQRKDLLRAVVAQNWPEPTNDWQLKTPIIEETQKASLGTGVVLTFKEHGVQKAVMLKVGSHYQGPRYAADPSDPTYMIAGGFLNLIKGEDPQVGVVRETGEELVDDKGNPILTIHPDRLKPMDTKTLTFSSGERRVVIGFMLELSPAEAQTIKAHVSRLENDDEYRRAVREHTKNPDTGKPEVCTVSILPLKEVLDGKHKLLHKDQMSLFKKIDEHLNSAEVIR